MGPTYISRNLIGDPTMRDTLIQFSNAITNKSVVASALMPDAHLGYDVPIGSVIRTEGVVYPGWVGYDIGCGVLGCVLSLLKEENFTEEIKKQIFDKIYEKIPTGFSVRSNIDEEIDTQMKKELSSFGYSVFSEGYGTKALGTLGSGNHFIEIGSCEETGEVACFIHSGSRGPGHNIASAYLEIKGAREGFDSQSDIGKQYIQDQKAMVNFALMNRKMMLGLVAEIVAEETKTFTRLVMGSFINTSHNHVEEEEGGKGTLLHRKGATDASKGKLGVIPGNMRDGCFIVRGKGSQKHLNSASHGAGRTLSRNQAKKTLNYEEFVNDLKTNKVYANTSKNVLDESPHAYKNVFDVLEAQKESIEVIAHFKPIINIKGV